jgi:hypothetical protein
MLTARGVEMVLVYNIQWPKEAYPWSQGDVVISPKGSSTNGVGSLRPDLVTKTPSCENVTDALIP